MNIEKNVSSSQDPAQCSPLEKHSTYQFDGKSFIVTLVFRKEGPETVGTVLLKLMQTEGSC